MPYSRATHRWPFSSPASFIYRPDRSSIFGGRSRSQVNPRIQTSGRETSFTDFVALWGRRGCRSMRSARLRSHEAFLHRSIENAAWVDRVLPPGPRSSGHPMVGHSVNMVKCAVIKMRVGSPSFSTLLPSVPVRAFSRRIASGHTLIFSRTDWTGNQYNPIRPGRNP